MTSLDRVVDDVIAELHRAIDRWPDTDAYPDGTGGGGRETWRTLAQNSCDRAYREGRCTWTHVLDEEASEALADTDPVKLRAELVQVAAMAIRWATAIDARGTA